MIHFCFWSLEAKSEYDDTVIRGSYGIREYETKNKSIKVKTLFAVSVKKGQVLFTCTNAAT